MSKTCRPILRTVRGEEPPFAASVLRLLFLTALSRFSLKTVIRSYKEESTLSRRTIGMPEVDELKDIARLLGNLWEAAQRLPEGSERQDAFRQIGNFQRRVAVLVTRAL